MPRFGQISIYRNSIRIPGDTKLICVCLGFETPRFPYFSVLVPIIKHGDFANNSSLNSTGDAVLV